MARGPVGTPGQRRRSHHDSSLRGDGDISDPWLSAARLVWRCGCTIFGGVRAPGVAANRAYSKAKRPATLVVDALDDAVPQMADELAASGRARDAGAHDRCGVRCEAAAL